MGQITANETGNYGQIRLLSLNLDIIETFQCYEYEEQEPIVVVRMSFFKPQGFMVIVK